MNFSSTCHCYNNPCHHHGIQAPQNNTLTNYDDFYLHQSFDGYLPHLNTGSPYIINNLQIHSPDMDILMQERFQITDLTSNLDQPILASPLSFQNNDTFEFSNNNNNCLFGELPISEIQEQSFIDNDNALKFSKNQPIIKTRNIVTLQCPSPPIEHNIVKRRRKSRTQPSQLVCDICLKTFTRPFNVKSHQKTHTNERPFKCLHPGCPWKFARTHDLKRHELKHSGIKPYACICGKRFSRSDVLKRHQQVEGCVLK